MAQSAQLSAAWRILAQLELCLARISAAQAQLKRSKLAQLNELSAAQAQPSATQRAQSTRNGVLTDRAVRIARKLVCAVALLCAFFLLVLFLFCLSAVLRCCVAVALSFP